MSQIRVENNQEKNQHTNNQVLEQDIVEEISTWLNKNILGVIKPKSLVDSLSYYPEKDVWISEILVYYENEESSLRVKVLLNKATGAISINPKLETLCYQLVKLSAQENRNSYSLPSTIDRTREFHWLKEHKREYANLWVALDGDRLLASGTNHREVFQAARSKGATRPLIVRVEAEDKLAYVGW